MRDCRCPTHCRCVLSGPLVGPQFHGTQLTSDMAVSVGHTSLVGVVSEGVVRMFES
jgi:hypothetical protein